MAKAVVLLDPDGLAQSRPILCAETPEEAQALRLPLIARVLAHLSAGKEMRTNGGTRYELFQATEHVGILEILDVPNK